MLWPLAFITPPKVATGGLCKYFSFSCFTPPKGEMEGAFVVILSPSCGNFYCLVWE